MKTKNTKNTKRYCYDCKLYPKDCRYAKLDRDILNDLTIIAVDEMHKKFKKYKVLKAHIGGTSGCVFENAVKLGASAEGSKEFFE